MFYKATHHRSSARGYVLLLPCTVQQTVLVKIVLLRVVTPLLLCSCTHAWLCIFTRLRNLIIPCSLLAYTKNTDATDECGVCEFDAMVICNKFGTCTFIKIVNGKLNSFPGCFSLNVFLVKYYCSLHTKQIKFELNWIQCWVKFQQHFKNILMRSFQY